MGKQLVAISGDNRPWTQAEIEAGLNRPKFKAPPSHDPIPDLEGRRSWWQGKINARTRFREEDAARIERLRGTVAEGSEPIEGATPDIHRRRDVAFMVTWAVNVVRGHVADHDSAIDTYQRRMATCRG